MGCTVESIKTMPAVKYSKTTLELVAGNKRSAPEDGDGASASRKKVQHMVENGVEVIDLT
jgi:hypothetical protein